MKTVKIWWERRSFREQVMLVGAPLVCYYAYLALQMPTTWRLFL